ncbi:MAG: hypothetical protein U0V72_15650 [Cytophagales bacterium]
MFLNKYLSVLFAILISVSCDKGKLNTKEYAKELAEKKIKRVTAGEISSGAYKLGTILDDTLSKIFIHGNCNVNELEVVKTFKKDFDAQIEVLQATDTLNMDAITKNLFQAAEYGVLHGEKSANEPNLQYLKNGYWLYSRPLKNNECKNGANFRLLSIKMSQAEIIKKLN